MGFDLLDIDQCRFPGELAKQFSRIEPGEVLAALAANLVMTNVQFPSNINNIQHWAGRVAERVEGTDGAVQPRFTELGCTLYRVHLADFDLAIVAISKLVVILGEVISFHDLGVPHLVNDAVSIMN